MLPSNKRANGRVVSNFSKEIFIIAVIGAAKKTPTTPHKIPQKIKDNTIVTGWSFKADPISLGSRKSPMIIFNIAGNAIIRMIGVTLVY